MNFFWKIKISFSSRKFYALSDDIKLKTLKDLRLNRNKKCSHDRLNWRDELGYDQILEYNNSQDNNNNLIELIHSLRI
ncbi:hypothetical protein BpHYR1_027170 [Brachionus plicatilis]|uniref:Uncharacterized protein n=1 Tax=Brachionus plicatilis TaxID=10195 RepID=A0A3M7QF65_BRAPC|nr:hypothetical protein BpHYR1_027170 [Brachionus plicatilis]